MFTVYDMNVMVMRRATGKVLEKMSAAVSNASRGARSAVFHCPGLLDGAFDALSSRGSELTATRDEFKKLHTHEFESWLNKQPEWFTDAVRAEVAGWVRKQFNEEAAKEAAPDAG